MYSDTETDMGNIMMGIRNALALVLSETLNCSCATDAKQWKMV